MGVSKFGGHDCIPRGRMQRKPFQMLREAKRDISPHMITYIKEVAVAVTSFFALIEQIIKYLLRNGRTLHNAVNSQ